VCESERGMGGEYFIERSHLRWTVSRWQGKGNHATNHSSDSDDDAGPESDAEPPGERYRGLAGWSGLRRQRHLRPRSTESKSSIRFTYCQM
jgi:hypothetical protein